MGSAGPIVFSGRCGVPVRAVASTSSSTAVSSNGPYMPAKLQNVLNRSVLQACRAGRKRSSRSRLQAVVASARSPSDRGQQPIGNEPSDIETRTDSGDSSSRPRHGRGRRKAGPASMACDDTVEAITALAEQMAYKAEESNIPASVRTPILHST